MNIALADSIRGWSIAILLVSIVPAALLRAGGTTHTAIRYMKAAVYGIDCCAATTIVVLFLSVSGWQEHWGAKGRDESLLLPGTLFAALAVAFAIATYRALKGSPSARLLTSPTGPVPPASTPTQDIRAILGSYGAVMEHSEPGLVYDVSVLPHPKQTIEAAMKAAFKITRDEPQRAMLSAALLSLADYQPGVGAEPLGLSLERVGFTKGQQVTPELLKALTNVKHPDEAMQAQVLREMETYQRWIAENS